MAYKNLSVTMNGDAEARRWRTRHPRVHRARVLGAQLSIVRRNEAVQRAGLRLIAVALVMQIVGVLAVPGVSSAATRTLGRASSNAVAARTSTATGGAVAFNARRPVVNISTDESRTHGASGAAAHSPPTRLYQGLSICTDASGLKIAQGRTQIVSGSAYITIIFVNEGTSNCYLNGTPFTQPVGATYTPVGPPSAAYFDPSRGGYVVLDAGGGSASTSLGIANASKYYPRSSCVPKKMIGVTLRFSYPADFFFRIAAGPIAVCKKITTTTITGVARGVIVGP